MKDNVNRMKRLHGEDRPEFGVDRCVFKIGSGNLPQSDKRDQVTLAVTNAFRHVLDCGANSRS